MAHSYHTKVPYKAIMRYILHYTEPGDIVFDGFCGTGMTAVAAQMCGNEDNDLKFNLTESLIVQTGSGRKSIISDLSPAATYISSVYNTKADTQDFQDAFNAMLKVTMEEVSGCIIQKMRTEKYVILIHTVGQINIYLPTMWRRNCFLGSRQLTKKRGSVRATQCSVCSAELTKKGCERAFKTDFDDYLGQIVKSIKQIPVLIAYEDGQEKTKDPDAQDLELIDKIEKIKIIDKLADRTPVREAKVEEMINME